MGNGDRRIHAVKRTRPGEKFLCGFGEIRDLTKDKFAFHKRLEIITCEECLKLAKKLIRASRPKKKKSAIKPKEASPGSATYKKFDVSLIPVLVRLSSSDEKEKRVRLGNEKINTPKEKTSPVVTDVPSDTKSDEEKRKFYMGVDVSPGRSPHHVA